MKKTTVWVAICMAFILVLILPVLAPAQSCPENKYPYQGRCLWLHEIECPRDQGYNQFKRRCVTCESEGKVWKDYPSGGKPQGGCSCKRCEDEVGGDCIPCAEMGARCNSNGECVGHRYEYQGDPVLHSGVADDMNEVKERIKFFKLGIQDLEGQLGRKVTAIFAFCECRNSRRIVWSHAIGKRAKNVVDKVSQTAKQCGGCLLSPITIGR